MAFTYTTAGQREKDPGLNMYLPFRFPSICFYLSTQYLGYPQPLGYHWHLMGY